MSLQDSVDAALERLRVAGTDLSDIEVKSASGGLPERIAYSVCAMANGGGGLIVLGLDEAAGFTPVPIDADGLAEKLVAACLGELEPPARPEIDIVTVAGMPVVAAAIRALDFTAKPCFVRRLGVAQGSFIRTHDGNRHLSPFEIHTLESRRGQPRDDLFPVPDSSAGFDEHAVSMLLARMRATRGPLLAARDDRDVLKMLGILALDDGELVPTLGGLMAVGSYPQESFPQLNTTFVVYPTSDGRPLADGTRFLDNQSLDGSIPVQLVEALSAIKRHMSRRARIIGAGREDIWEYPEEALREVVVNALMHRDYSPLARGAQVRIVMYPDRIEVTSPGGLFGNVDIDDLMSEPVSSSRNSYLAKTLEDVEVGATHRTVCENRGSGLLALAETLRQAGMQPPLISVDLKSFKVTLYNHSLLDPDTLNWLTTSSTADLSHSQRLGLALARRAGQLTNSSYRVATGVDPATATKELSALAQAGWLTRDGGRRFAIWSLVPPAQQPATVQSHPANQDAALAFLADGPKSSREVAEHLGVSKQSAAALLGRMREQGAVEPTEARIRNPKNRWRLATPSR